MGNLGEDILALVEEKARASADEEGLVGIVRQWYIQGFIESFFEGFVEGFLEAYIELLHHIMRHFGKSYDEAALHLTLPTAEIELYRPLVQAYVSDQELYQTLLDETIGDLLCRKKR